MDKKLFFCVVYVAAVLQPAAAYAKNPPPSIEFLEYLADTTVNHGKWVDPLAMKNINIKEQSDKSKKKQTTDNSEREHRDE